MSKSNRALTSFDCGLQKSSNLVHNVAKVRSLSVKPHDTTKSIPSSPDHAMSFLHCLVSDSIASSQSKMFSHFSFHFRNWWYKPSMTVQSILGPSMYDTNCCSCLWRLAEWASACDCSLICPLAWGMRVGFPYSMWHTKCVAVIVGYNQWCSNNINEDMLAYDGWTFVGHTSSCVSLHKCVIQYSTRKQVKPSI